MRNYLSACLLFLVSSAVVAVPPGICRVESRASMDVTYPAVYAAFEEARFWVLFEADVGRN